MLDLSATERQMALNEVIFMSGFLKVHLQRTFFFIENFSLRSEF